MEPHVPFVWPPKDPTTYYEPRPLPETPWTYGSGVNPHLEPSNARLRAQVVRQKRASGTGSKKQDSFTSFLKSLDNDDPDSHTPSPASSDVDPDADWGNDDGDMMTTAGGGREHDGGQEMYEEDEDSDAYDTRTGRPKARRGSEGWEVKPLTAWAREEIVRRYAARRGLGREHDEDEGSVPGPGPEAGVGQGRSPGDWDNDVPLRADAVPAQQHGNPGWEGEAQRVPLVPPDKYNRYVPSAEDSDSSDEDDPPDEGRFRDRLWEEHIDAWEGRVNGDEAGESTQNGDPGRNLSPDGDGVAEGL